MSELKTFQDMVGKWANDTFGKDIQTYEGVMAHLIKEVDELSENHDPVEAADCFLLLLQHAHERGYDLFEQAIKKHRINLIRKWGPPDENGCIEHIRQDICPECDNELGEGIEIWCRTCAIHNGVIS